MTGMMPVVETRPPVNGHSIRQVTSDHPCPVCQATHRCAFTTDGRIAKCCLISAGSYKTTSDDVGEAYWHRLTDDSAIVTATEPGTIHDVYTAMLTTPILATPRRVSDEITTDLKRRGLDDQTILKNQYRSVNRDLANELAKRLRMRFGEFVFKVPGFSKWPNGKPRLWYPHHKRNGDGKSIPVSDVLLIPARNPGGKIVGVKARIYDPKWDGGNKYLWMTSAKTGGAGATNAVHVPLGTPAKSARVRVTEGELKADIAFQLDGIPTISIPGVSSHGKALPILVELGAEIVVIAFDADCWTNANVAKAQRKLFNALVKAKYQVEVAYWDFAAGKGIDDLLSAGGTPQIATGDDARKLVDQIYSAATNGANDTDDTNGDQPALKLDKVSNTTRCDVSVLAEEHRTISAVVAELPRAVNVYQRGGSLVRILDDFRPQDLAIDRHQPASRIGELPLPSLREQITRLVRLSQPDDESGSEFHPPEWLIKGIAARGVWPGVPHLEAVVPNPVFGTDGTIASQRGYDAKTGLYIDSDIVVTVPDRPTQADAKAAVERLLFLVSDFPFQRLYHKSAWLAFLLTLLVRFAFNGPTPFFLVDGSAPGVGKTLLLELVVLIVTGKKLPRMSLPESDDEFRKVITALAMCGASIVLFDNIATVLGCASLDAALTSTIWRDRPLGRSEIAEFPLNITWTGSGNNVQLKADTGRRVGHIRLQAMVENPENRSGFKIENIVEHILANRAEYLSAAFTILKAYHVAGRPDVKLSAWGSYEAWSAAVRAPLVWCGQEDPAATREEFVQFADREAGMLSQLLSGWEELDPERKGLTVAEAIRLLNKDKEAYPTLRQALEELAPPKDGKFSNKSIGKRLTHLRGRICGGRAFDSRLNSSKVQSWSVTQVVSPQVATDEPAKTATDSPDKSGFTGFTGFVSPPLKEEMNNTADTHIHTHTQGGETNPVNPSNPESGSSDWWDGVTFPT